MSGHPSSHLAQARTHACSVSCCCLYSFLSFFQSEIEPRALWEPTELPTLCQLNPSPSSNPNHNSNPSPSPNLNSSPSPQPQSQTWPQHLPQSQPQSQAQPQPQIQSQSQPCPSPQPQSRPGPHPLPLAFEIIFLLYSCRSSADPMKTCFNSVRPWLNGCNFPVLQCRH